MVGQNKIPYFFYVFLGMVLVVISLSLVALRLPYGFGFHDEGYYLDCAHRLVKGDRPFLGEFSTVTRYFDLFLGQLMKIIPFDNVLLWRWVGFILQLIYLIIFSLLLYHILPLPLLLFTMSAVLLFAPFNLWVLNYKNTNVGFIILGVTFWLICVFLKNKQLYILLGVLSGLMFFFLFLVYATLSAVFLIPLVVLVLPYSRIEDELRRPVKLMFITFMLCLFLTAGTLFFTGTIRHIVDNFIAFISCKQYSAKTNPFFVFIKILFFSKSLLFPLFAFIFIGLICDRFVFRKLQSMLFPLILLTLSSFLFYNKTEPVTLSRNLTLFNLSLMGFAIGKAISAWKRKSFDVKFKVSLILLLTACMAYFIVGIFSALGCIAEGNTTIWLLWPSIIAVLYNCKEENKHLWAISHVIKLLPFTILMLFFAANHLLSWVYYDHDISKLNFAFSHPKLKGIYSSERRVKEIESLLSAVEQRFNKKDPILIFTRSRLCDCLYGLTYLTDTLPLLKVTTVGFGCPCDEIIKKWLLELESKGKNPSYVVFTDFIESDKELSHYISSNYVPDVKIGFYNIWKLRNSKQQN